MNVIPRNKFHKLETKILKESSNYQGGSKKNNNYMGQIKTRLNGTGK